MDFAPEWKTKKAGRKIRQGINIAHDPIVRRRGRQSLRWCVRPWLHSERRLEFGHSNSAHGRIATIYLFIRNFMITTKLEMIISRIATRRRGILQNFPADGAHNV